ncbi:glycogen synthase GlgA [Brachyspira hampsonii]|uniref:Glycogen synthase n=1 Tax=Brachyspira hampsonii 30446 TaxID=1289135 RepID=A0A2U4F4T8_9SPIR|nr:glycogen synthase GlgA [Brachyspira hampsonii]EKV55950.1 glycogen/starch synthase [Brachyspira hampsonii 30446]MBW5388715.1 glycogen synthase GlgA [Brachyspira hampsonii]MBW5394012.1 glycogen synthase GlgA [Brachyspira hampsonii]OEJ19720.1 glycogen synthase [Brachyspira hampsonii]PTY40074.1 glycogen synthase [Brachyspira hampsonii bv. II]
MSKIKVMIASSEATPFIKTGGLADVVGALPIYLKKLDVEAFVVLPKYRDINFQDCYLENVLPTMGVWMGNGEEWCSVFKTVKDGIDFYFIEHHNFFSREGLYHDASFNDYQDNAWRFGFFSRAALQLCKDLQLNVDVVHANDWQTAAISAYIKTWHWNDIIGHAASMLTIHNANYQGIYNAATTYDYLGLGWNNFSPDTFEDHGNINLLKGGIFFSDVVTTVSPTYAREIASPYGGHGMAPYLQNKTTSFFGILNGIDENVWSPEKDKFIPENFSADKMEGKKVCKKELQKRFLLEEDDDVVLIGAIGRFVDQKGYHFIASIIDSLVNNMKVQFCILGTGDKGLESFFGDIPKRYPGRVGSYIGYSNELSHLIEAGCDLFVMPSLFEPCGLNQMYSLRYGTLPIVHATGGLEDTVENYNEETGEGTGFKFYDSNPSALYNTIGWAVSVYYDHRDRFTAMQKRAMKIDNSWEKSAKEYVKAYELAILNKNSYDINCGL